MNLPNAGEMAQRPKTNQLRPRGQSINTLALNSREKRAGSPCNKEQEVPKTVVKFEGHPAMLGKDEERRRKERIWDFPRPIIKPRLVEDQARGRKDVELLNRLASGDKPGG